MTACCRAVPTTAATHRPGKGYTQYHRFRELENNNSGIPKDGEISFWNKVDVWHGGAHFDRGDRQLSHAT